MSDYASYHLKDSGLEHLLIMQKPVTGRDTHYPLTKPNNPQLGDTYFDLDEFKKYFYNNGQFSVSKDTTLDEMQKIIFFRTRLENTFYCKRGNIDFSFIDLYLYHYMKLTSIDKFVARKNGWPIVIYQIKDKMDLVMFQMLMANQIN